MNYWLVKSDPDEYTIDQLAREKTTAWTGVRNYQARNNLVAMRRGDQVFFYHSQATPPAIVGVATVHAEAYPDETQFEPNSEYFDGKSTRENPRWQCVDLKFREAFAQPLTLADIKADKRLASMVLVRAGRLSVQPVSAAEAKVIFSLVGSEK